MKDGEIAVVVGRVISVDPLALASKIGMLRKRRLPNQCLHLMPGPTIDFNLIHYKLLRTAITHVDSTALSHILNVVLV